jgi:glucose-fructose oxidoreductase
MTAYRLHFEPANLRAVELARRGRLGEVRLFSSTFCMQVREDNVRLERELGGGPLLDLGIYCINAARYLFRAEPVEVTATFGRGHDERFREVPEAASVTLRFPKDRLATFACSFGAAHSSAYDLIGTKGRVRLEPAYSYAEALVLEECLGSRRSRRRFTKRDQFAPEILYFSDCILAGREPEPAGIEGAIDVAIVEAASASARIGQPVALELPTRARRPDESQAASRPSVSRVALVHAASPSR